MEDTPASDRRPIAVRRFFIFHQLAQVLARRGISPNAISVSSIVAAIFAALSFSLTSSTTDFQPLFWILGVFGVLLRLLANLLDGMVAVEYEKSSPTGALYNEVPDRISDTIIFIGLGSASGGSLVLALFASLGAIFTAYVRALGKTVAGYQEFCGPMAKQQRMFLVSFCAVLSAFGWERVQIVNWDAGLPALTLLVIAIGSFHTTARRLKRVANTLAKTA